MESINFSLICAGRQLIGEGAEGNNVALLGNMFSRSASGSESLLGAADGLGGSLDRDQALRVGIGKVESPGLVAMLSECTRDRYKSIAEPATGLPSPRPLV